MVLTLAIVDLAHVGYHVRGENAHDGATGAGFQHWECLEGGRRGSGDYDEGTVGLRDRVTGHGCLDCYSEVGTGVPMLGGCGDQGSELELRTREGLLYGLSSLVVV